MWKRNKFMAVALSLSLVLGNVTPAFASDTHTLSGVSSIDEAINGTNNPKKTINDIDEEDEEFIEEEDSGPNARQQKYLDEITGLAEKRKIYSKNDVSYVSRNPVGLQKGTKPDIVTIHDNRVPTGKKTCCTCVPVELPLPVWVKNTEDDPAMVKVVNLPKKKYAEVFSINNDAKGAYWRPKASELPLEAWVKYQGTKVAKYAYVNTDAFDANNFTADPKINELVGDDKGGQVTVNTPTQGDVKDLNKEKKKDVNKTYDIKLSIPKTESLLTEKEVRALNILGEDIILRDEHFSPFSCGLKKAGGNPASMTITKSGTYNWGKFKKPKKGKAGKNNDMDPSVSGEGLRWAVYNVEIGKSFVNNKGMLLKRKENGKTTIKKLNTAKATGFQYINQNGDLFTVPKDGSEILVKKIDAIPVLYKALGQYRVTYGLEVMDDDKINTQNAETATHIKQDKSHVELFVSRSNLNKYLMSAYEDGILDSLITIKPGYNLTDEDAAKNKGELGIKVATSPVPYATLSSEKGPKVLNTGTYGGKEVPMLPQNDITKIAGNLTMEDVLFMNSVLTSPMSIVSNSLNGVPKDLIKNTYLGPFRDQDNLYGLMGKDGKVGGKTSVPSSLSDIDFKDNLLTYRQLFKVTHQMMRIYGEPELNQKEQDILFKFYRWKTPAGLKQDSPDYEDYKYLIARGMIDFEVPSIDAPVTRENLLDIAVKMRDPGSRIDFKKLDVTAMVSDELGNAGYFSYSPKVERIKRNTKQLNGQITVDVPVYIVVPKDAKIIGDIYNVSTYGSIAPQKITGAKMKKGSKADTSNKKGSGGYKAYAFDSKFRRIMFSTSNMACKQVTPKNKPKNFKPYKFKAKTGYLTVGDWAQYKSKDQNAYVIELKPTKTGYKGTTNVHKYKAVKSDKKISELQDLISLTNLDEKDDEQVLYENGNIPTGEEDPNIHLDDDYVKELEKYNSDEPDEEETDANEDPDRDANDPIILNDDPDLNEDGNDPFAQSKAIISPRKFSIGIFENLKGITTKAAPSTQQSQTETTDTGDNGNKTNFDKAYNAVNDALAATGKTKKKKLSKTFDMESKVFGRADVVSVSDVWYSTGPSNCNFWAQMQESNGKDKVAVPTSMYNMLFQAGPRKMKNAVDISKRNGAFDKKYKDLPKLSGKQIIPASTVKTKKGAYAIKADKVWDDMSNDMWAVVGSEDAILKRAMAIDSLVLSGSATYTPTYLCKKTNGKITAVTPKTDKTKKGYLGENRKAVVQANVSEWSPGKDLSNQKAKTFTTEYLIADDIELPWVSAGKIAHLYRVNGTGSTAIGSTLYAFEVEKFGNVNFKMAVLKATLKDNGGTVYALLFADLNKAAMDLLGFSGKESETEPLTNDPVANSDVVDVVKEAGQKGTVIDKYSGTVLNNPFADTIIRGTHGANPYVYVNLGKLIDVGLVSLSQEPTCRNGRSLLLNTQYGIVVLDNETGMIHKGNAMYKLRRDDKGKPAPAWLIGEPSKDGKIERTANKEMPITIGMGNSLTSASSVDEKVFGEMIWINLMAVYGPIGRYYSLVDGQKIEDCKVNLPDLEEDVKYVQPDTRCNIVTTGTVEQAQIPLPTIDMEQVVSGAKPVDGKRGILLDGTNPFADYITWYDDQKSRWAVFRIVPMLAFSPTTLDQNKQVFREVTDMDINWDEMGLCPIIIANQGVSSEADVKKKFTDALKTKDKFFTGWMTGFGFVYVPQIDLAAKDKIKTRANKDNLVKMIKSYTEASSANKGINRALPYFINSGQDGSEISYISPPFSKSNNAYLAITRAEKKMIVADGFNGKEYVKKKYSYGGTQSKKAALASMIPDLVSTNGIYLQFIPKDSLATKDFDVVKFNSSTSNMKLYQFLRSGLNKKTVVEETIVHFNGLSGSAVKTSNQVAGDSVAINLNTQPIKHPLKAILTIDKEADIFKVVTTPINKEGDSGSKIYCFIMPKRELGAFVDPTVNKQLNKQFETKGSFSNKADVDGILAKWLQSDFIKRVQNLVQVIFYTIIVVFPMLLFIDGSLLFLGAILCDNKVFHKFCEKYFDPIKVLTLGKMNHGEWTLRKAIGFMIIPTALVLALAYNFDTLLRFLANSFNQLVNMM